MASGCSSFEKPTLSESIPNDRGLCLFLIMICIQHFQFFWLLFQIKYMSNLFKFLFLEETKKHQTHFFLSHGASPLLPRSISERTADFTSYLDSSGKRNMTECMY